MFSNPLSNEATSFNKAAILAARLTGNGRCTLDTISAWLSIPPPLTPSAYSYSEYNKDLSETSTSNVAKQSMVVAAHEFHQMDGKPVDEVIDTNVTVDGKNGAILPFLVS